MTHAARMFRFLRMLIFQESSWLLLCIALSAVTPRAVMSQEQIMIGYDGHAGFQGPIWATKDLDLLEKNGLIGDLILIPGSARGMAALISGSVPFIQGSAIAPLAAFVRGGDVAVIAAALDKIAFSVLVRLELKSPAHRLRKQ